MKVPKPPSGRDIWEALRTEFSANLYELPSLVLPPTVYHVYLHAEDYAVVEGIIPRIKQEVANALTREVSRMNQETARQNGRIWNRLRPDLSMPVELPPRGWEVHVERDHDGELQRGQLGVLSKLMMPAPPDYSGPPTVLSVRSTFSGGQRTSTVSVPDAPTSRTATQGQDVADAIQAALSYVDEDGPHLFPLRKRCTKIGRGGSDAWVDLQVMADPRVSREHCWILHDTESQFFVRDVSSWGTSVNGEALAPPERTADGQVVAPGAVKELKSGDRIELAGVLTMTLQIELP